VKRPTSDQVIEIVSEMGQNGEAVSVAAVVAMIRERTGCSRATAYRGVADAMAASVIHRGEGETAGEGERAERPRLNDARLLRHPSPPSRRLPSPVFPPFSRSGT
jgi:hypothetical protein